MLTIKYIIIIISVNSILSFFLYKKIFSIAIVRFIGTTLFAEGIWIGIEFISRSLGKNDGSVDGHVYFQCKQNHGLFIRPNRLTLTKK
jgi:dynactin complex subunit